MHTLPSASGMGWRWMCENLPWAFFLAPDTRQPMCQKYRVSQEVWLLECVPSWGTYPRWACSFCFQFLLWVVDGFWCWTTKAIGGLSRLLIFVLAFHDGVDNTTVYSPWFLGSNSDQYPCNAVDAWKGGKTPLSLVNWCFGSILWFLSANSPGHFKPSIFFHKQPNTKIDQAFL